MSHKVSVILPVFNGALYIRQCLDSLLNQTYDNFEVIIIDDCSTDQTATIIQEYQDSRMKYFRNDINRGIVYSLNRAIALSCGEYIARMDADDICLPERLERQAEYLDQHANIGLVSTWFEMFGEKNGPIKYETDSERIRCKLLFSLQLLHPGWMFRRSLVKDNNLVYREEYRHAEDWDFLVRASAVTHFSNISEVLMRYRINPGQVSQVFNESQRKVADAVARNQLASLGISLEDDEFYLYRNTFGRREKCLTKDEMKRLIRILKGLEEANLSKRIYQPAVLRSVIQEELFYLCYYNLLQQSTSGLLIFASGYYKGLRIGGINRFKLMVRALWIFLRKETSSTYLKQTLDQINRG